MTFVTHDAENSGQAPERTLYPVNSPLRVRRDKVQELLALPQYQHTDIMDLITLANQKILGKHFNQHSEPAHVTDRATAIAVMEGVK